MNVAAIVVAAGRSIRMGSELPKVLLPLAGAPMLVHTLRALNGARQIQQVVVVVGRDYADRAHAVVDQVQLWPTPITIAVGGAQRQDSVAAGLERVPADVDVVAVHDGARPLVPSACVSAVIEAAAIHEAAVLAVPTRDTAKLVDGDGIITATPPRDAVWLAQTPQVFRTSLLREAHTQARRDGVIATDDAALVERLGVKVRVIRGDPINLKITTPEDLQWAEWYLRSGAAPR